MDNIITKNNPLQEHHLTEGAAVLIDKPLEWTSFDVVNKIRYPLSRKVGVKRYKVGHAGTLDPLATGLLILCIGKYTKKIDTFVGMQKGYEAAITLGADTASYDAEIPPHKYYPNIDITPDQIEELATTFSGRQDQLPPMYSAIKIKGQALYKLARKGKDVVRKTREIHIHKLDVTQTAPKELHAVVACSKGTYIRTLAYDFGQHLKTGAYLSGLRRTHIGEFSVDNALDIETFIKMIKPSSDHEI